MKHKGKNRVLAALLAAAMMFQMLPLMVFADDGAASSDVKIEGKEGTYTSLKEAVEKAESGDTILLGEGNYTLYGISSDGTTKDKDLTFVGLGPDKTAWNIGAKVLNSGECDTTYKDDFSLKGSKNVTFKNMTLRSGTANYLGFKHSNDTVVENCALYGRTTYWGYNSAKFIGSTFYAPNGDYAIWTYYCKEMTLDNCTFNTSGKVVNVYSDFEADQRDYTINFNNCTVNSTSFNKQALNINDSNKGTHKNTININNSTVTAARDRITCSQIFGFGEKSKYNAGNTDVYLNGKLVWSEGEMKTHDYTDGEKDNAYTIDPVSEWENKGDHFERKVTKTCNYCKRQFPNVTEKGYQLSYDLNDGTGAAGVDYESKIYPEGEKATVAAAPALNGYRFVAWQDEADNCYPVGMELTLTANTTLTALWESVDKPEPDPGPGPSPDPDPEPGDDGSGAVIGVVIGGAAVIGGYELATRLYLKHLIGVVPSTRGELALLMWEHADKPEPKTAFTYSDIDEDDTDLQKAAQWCVENEYLHVRDNDNDRFHPNGWVPKLKVIQAWDKAFGLQAKANADK